MKILDKQGQNLEWAVMKFRFTNSISLDIRFAKN